MTPLNALTFPLSQNALIEASAGTGKTFTISNLYLRLVTGHQCEPLSVAQILILTFTNAATAELKERILARIQESLRDFTRGCSDDYFIKQLLLDITDHTSAAQRLRIAVQEMDMASVFTIHGFCQRMLTEHAFESGGEWQHAMLLDDAELIDTAVKDYWRKIVAHLAPKELHDFLGYWAVPDNLGKSLRPVIFRDIGNQSPTQLKQAWHKAESAYLLNIEEAQQWWRNNQVSQMLADADLKANVKLGKPAFQQLLTEFAMGALPDLGKEGWLTLAPEKVAKARKKSSANLPVEEFERFVVLDKLQQDAAKLQQQAYFWQALQFVRQHLARSKAARSQLAPDDLLQNLRAALKGDAGKHLALAIQQQYPVTLIDEFQDTDEVQFAIFKAVYIDVDMTEMGSSRRHSQNTSLILIGDPKQAIYSFRGGDIYTYLHAKQLVDSDSLFTLDTNWRSNPSLIEAVNQLFGNSDIGFMNDGMPFYPVKAGRVEKPVTKQGLPLTAMQFSILPSKPNAKGIFDPLKWADAAVTMSQACAADIAQYLQQVQVADQPVQAGDICILVRDRFEADLMQSALKPHQIDSVFLLKETVFKSRVAYSLLLLFKAVLDYKSEVTIKAALLDWVMCFSNAEFAALVHNTVRWQQVLTHFNHAWTLLNNKSVMTALDYLLLQFNVFARLANQYQESDRIITDIRHLGEILQKQSHRMEGHAALLKWFAQRVADPDRIKADNIEDIQWRLETDQNLVQITTIHASKGLQYPFVFVPFVSRFKANFHGFYHDEQHKLNYELAANEQLQAAIDVERLSEDIRLFYVAITRAIYHCWLGVWDNNIAGRKLQSGFGQTAFGQLISTPEMVENHHEAIAQRLRILMRGCATDIIMLHQPSEALVDTQPLVQPTETSMGFDVARLQDSIRQTWFLTSYSAISKQKVMPDSDLHAEESFKASDEVMVSENSADNHRLSQLIEIPLAPLEMRFAFARGAGPGSYLHEVLEEADFNDKNHLRAKSTELADKFSISKEDIPGVVDWLWEVLAAPIGQVSLRALSAEHRLPEMEFWLPLHQVDIGQFNHLVQTWIPGHTGEYRLQTLNGMLKGFLDLVYTFNGQFFVADYKSNYLGDHYNDYQHDALHHAMLHHDYYLQALLYSLALHRYLKLKVFDYSYEKYIGGAQYLFLRGMSVKFPGCGVLQVTPPESVILALDALFQEVPVEPKAGHSTS